LCTEAATRAQAAVDAHMHTITELEAQVVDLKAKDAVHQANLQRAWTELAEQRKAAAETAGAAQSEALEKQAKPGPVTLSTHA
jgi:hypothetical protein